MQFVCRYGTPEGHILTQVQELSRLAQENFVSTQKTTIGTRNQKDELKEIVQAMKSLNDLSEKMMETQRRFRLGGA